MDQRELPTFGEIPMKNDIYNLVTVDNGKSDTASIIKVFSEMAAGKLRCDLRLLNYYSEVPVSYDSTINSVEMDCVELSVHEHQALIMKQEKSTIVKSKHFHDELAVHCYASYVNVQKKTVILNNFAFAQVRAERREAVRVAVHGTLCVKFSSGNAEFEGSLVDISGNGLSINTYSAPATDFNQPGLLHFSLAGAPLVVTGSFVRCTMQGNGQQLCVFRMEPDRRSDGLIGKFIYQRQVEIIQELKEGLISN